MDYVLLATDLTKRVLGTFDADARKLYDDEFAIFESITAIR